jgi:hypothetical protein
MAYRQIIRINPYSPSSVKQAIKLLENEKKNREDNLGEIGKLNTIFAKKIAEGIAKKVVERYGEVDSTNRNVKHVDISVDFFGHHGKATVQARGQGLFFVEFGTGTMATSGYGWRYGFYPGSWSESHGRTFQEWASTNTGEDYPYDNEAADAFTYAINRMDDIIREAADEVFG